MPMRVFHQHRRPAPQKPRFHYPVLPTPGLQLPSVTVWVQSGLPANVSQILTFMANCLEPANATLAQLFGIPVLTGFNCIIAALDPALDGEGGAFHDTCQARDLYCDAALNPAVNAPLTTALYFAELVECYSYEQAKGWDCGSVNGEAMSRILAAELISEAGAPGTLDGYETASGWLDSDRADYVTTNLNTDTDPLGNGCGVLFLNWLRTQKSLPEIVQAAGASLAETYANLGLGATTDAFTAFRAATDAKWPVGSPSGVTSDSPW